VRKRVFWNGRIIDLSIFSVRGGGWTAHFSVEDHRADPVLVRYCETGQVFGTRDAAEQAATRVAIKTI
jgi:hypothetical protein